MDDKQLIASLESAREALIRASLIRAFNSLLDENKQLRERLIQTEASLLDANTTITCLEKEQVIEMYVCEVPNLVLHEGLYQLNVDPTCEQCKDISASNKEYKPTGPVELSKEDLERIHQEGLKARDAVVNAFKSKETSNLVRAARYAVEAQDGLRNALKALDTDKKQKTNNDG